MKEQRIIRRRDPTARHRRRIERRMSLGAADGVFAHPEDALVPVGAVPHLTLPEPEAGRNTIVSAGLSALFHASILAAILLAGYLAPEVVSEAIPLSYVESKPPPTLKELPGRNDSSPAPRALARRGPASTAALAQASPVQASPVPLASAARVSAASLDMARVDTARAPTRVDMARVTNRPLAAHTPVAPTPSAADIGPVRTFEVSPEALTAPVAEISGPTYVATGAPVAIDAPGAFAQYAVVGSADYSDVPSATAPSAVGVGATDFDGTAVETGVSGEYLGSPGGGSSGGSSGGTSGPTGLPGGVPGGTGTRPASVPCLESAYVDRYLQIVKQRTETRWELPDDAAPDEQVILRFKLDFAGAATDVKIFQASTDAFGTSAQEALRQASPFPPMDDNVRCLIEKTIKLTFRHPAS